MKVRILVEKEIDIRFAECEINVGWWEDSDVNGKSDDNDNPQMPCIDRDLWRPIIDLDEGKIINWKIGTTAKTYYKVRDGVTVMFLDSNYVIIKTYEGYVPKFLSPDNPGWFSGEDYLEMTIDENGYIKNFNGDLSDVFMDKKDN